MIITWTSIRSPHKPGYSQPEPDTITVGPLILDFSDPGIVEYDVSDHTDYVQKAWREDGVLHLRVLAHYQAENAITVERTIDYGEREELSWNV